MRYIYLDAAIFVRRTKGKRPGLNQLQHLAADVLVGGRLHQVCVGFTIGFVSDFLVNRRTTVLHDRFEHHQSVESSVWIRREDLLLNLRDRILRTLSSHKVKRKLSNLSNTDNFNLT